MSLLQGPPQQQRIASGRQTGERVEISQKHRVVFRQSLRPARLGAGRALALGF
jgi:hypothetical protein